MYIVDFCSIVMLFYCKTDLSTLYHVSLTFVCFPKLSTQWIKMQSVFAFKMYTLLLVLAQYRVDRRSESLILLYKFSENIP